MERDLVVLVGRDGSGEESEVARHGWSPIVDLGDPELLPVLDVPHPDAGARARFGRRPRIPVDAVVWLATGHRLPADLAGTYEESFRLTVQPHVGWRPDVKDPADPADVVKQVSFLAAADGYDQERFRTHYRHHVELARLHMPSMWQYVQNDVVAQTGDGEAAKGIAAVSELWFRSTDDFLHRYFPSAEDEARFRAEEGFLDLTRAVSFVCSSMTLTHREGGR